MKRITLLSCCSLIAAMLLLQSFVAGDDNTTELGKSVEGNNGPTPLKVYINKNNKVERIEFLKSQETPKYYAKVKEALKDKWNGLKVKEAKTLQVDAVTGATYSSNAVIENVRLALDYYLNHK